MKKYQRRKDLNRDISGGQRRVGEGLAWKCTLLQSGNHDEAVEAGEERQRKELSLVVKLPHMGRKRLCVGAKTDASGSERECRQRQKMTQGFTSANNWFLFFCPL